MAEAGTAPLKVAIVGGGISGLICVRELLTTSHVPLEITLLEASESLGGRIRKVVTPSRGIELDAGAEFIHGRGHILWDTIRDFQSRGLLPMTRQGEKDDEEFYDFEELEPYFILSHADGGPEDHPTPQGKYGMYFLDGELLMYNDPKVQPLVDALGEIFDVETSDRYSDNTSLADALAERHDQELSTSLMDLCIAGYGNTAGCCHLDQLSVRRLIEFESYWERNEIEGDFRPRFGMHRLIEAMVKDIELSSAKASHSLDIRLMSPVHKISATDESGCVTVHSLTGNSTPSSLDADYIVVAVPPTRLLELFDDGMSFPDTKREALSRIGFAGPIVKICCTFKKSFWPNKVQSIIAIGQPIPEIWFREVDDGKYNVATGYLVSTAAEEFLQRISSPTANQVAGKECSSRELNGADLMLKQLCTIFQVSLDEIQESWVRDDTILVDWKEDFPYIQGGYLYPKVGMLKTDLTTLAEPLGRIFFAGEATNINATCTIQAAMETGVRAAKEILFASTSQ